MVPPLSSGQQHSFFVELRVHFQDVLDSYVTLVCFDIGRYLPAPLREKGSMKCGNYTWTFFLRLRVYKWTFTAS